MMLGLPSLCVPGLAVLLLAVAPLAQAGLYSSEDPLVSLSGGAHSMLLRSRSAWLAEFYASWCGHCRNFKQTWLTLARDVKDWRPVVYLAVLDCAEEANSDICTEFGVSGYPTLKFFKHSTENPSDGVKTAATSVTDIRHNIIKNLEKSPPPTCPPLNPISATHVDQFFEDHNDKYLALIFENDSDYTGREVTLDLLQFEGVSVRRALSDQSDLVERFKVSSFPSLVLLSRNGSISCVQLEEAERSSFTHYLQSLPGVNRKNLPLIGWAETSAGGSQAARRNADSSKVYMADLESALHYSLLVEAARFPTLEGERLKALSGFVKVLRKYFPARPMLRTLLNVAGNWLRNKVGTKVSYKDFEDVLNNKNQPKLLKAVLAPDVNYVWCQGSKPEFRGYPCSLWTLFHTLSVQAANLASQGLTRAAPLEVLLAMREYVKYFFGCRECAKHFESMAAESIRTVRSMDEAVIWLWERHNRVNKRLAGAVSEDPEFPKVPWPMKELCPLCLSSAEGTEPTWDTQAVLQFLKAHFDKKNIDNEYLESEQVLLTNQRKAGGLRRRRRDVETSEAETVIAASELEDEIRNQTLQHQKPSIIKMKLPAHPEPEEIVDLDSSARRLYPSRTIQNIILHEDEPALHPETLQDPPDADFDHVAARERLLKRGVDTKYLIGVVVVESGEGNWKGRWVKMLEVGFSRLDISLCVVLYFLSSMCLLIMYLYLSLRTRCLRPPSYCPQV